MMGHPGRRRRSCRSPSRRTKAGIKMMYQNVPVPEVVATFGGGYVGAQQEPQGRALGAEAVRRFGLKSGDTAIVIGPFDDREPRRARARHGRGARGSRHQGRPDQLAARNGPPIRTSPSRSSPPRSQQSRRQADRLSRRPDARQRADLHAGGRQEAGRHLQLRLRHQPADRRGASRAAGCS